MTITPEFIPHSKFHEGKWLLSVDRPEWYYFMKKKNTNVISNESFIESVDEPLKELVRFLHKKGIRTTPSCAGHFISDRNLESIYDSLVADEVQIKNNGIKLKDIETGKTVVFKNEKYHVPWSRNLFIKKLASYQQHGVIGIRTGRNKKLKQSLLKIKADGATVKSAVGAVFIFTHENNKEDNRKTWKNITEAVMESFRQ